MDLSPDGLEAAEDEESVAFEVRVAGMLWDASPARRSADIARSTRGSLVVVPDLAAAAPGRSARRVDLARGRGRYDISLATGAYRWTIEERDPGTRAPSVLATGTMAFCAADPARAFVIDVPLVPVDVKLATRGPEPEHHPLGRYVSLSGTTDGGWVDAPGPTWLPPGPMRALVEHKPSSSPQQVLGRYEGVVDIPLGGGDVTVEVPTAEVWLDLLPHLGDPGPTTAPLAIFGALPTAGTPLYPLPPRPGDRPSHVETMMMPGEYDLYFEVRDPDGRVGGVVHPANATLVVTPGDPDAARRVFPVLEPLMGTFTVDGAAPGDGVATELIFRSGRAAVRDGPTAPVAPDGEYRVHLVTGATYQVAAKLGLDEEHPLGAFVFEPGSPVPLDLVRAPVTVTLTTDGGEVPEDGLGGRGHLVFRSRTQPAEVRVPVPAGSPAVTRTRLVPGTYDVAFVHDKWFFEAELDPIEVEPVRGVDVSRETGRAQWLRLVRTIGGDDALVFQGWISVLRLEDEGFVQGTRPLHVTMDGALGHVTLPSGIYYLRYIDGNAFTGIGLPQAVQGPLVIP